jgi:hypothetical protein
MKKIWNVLLVLVLVFGLSTSLFAARSFSYTIITGNSSFDAASGISATKVFITSNYQNLASISNMGAVTKSYGYIAGVIQPNGYSSGAPIAAMARGDVNTPNNVVTIVTSMNAITGLPMIMWVVPTDGAAASVNYTPTTNLRYVIVRSSTPDFSTSTRSISNVTSANAAQGITLDFSSIPDPVIDPAKPRNAITPNYSMVRAVASDGTMSPTSTIITAMKIVVAPNPGSTDEFRFSPPYNCNYKTALDLLRKYSPNGDVISRMEYFDYNTQTYSNPITYLSVVMGGITYSGWDEDNNFDLIPTRAVTMVVSGAKVTLNLLGTNDDSVTLDIAALPGNPGETAQYRLSIPQNCSIRTLADLMVFLNGGVNNGEKVSIIGSFSYHDQQYNAGSYEFSGDWYSDCPPSAKIVPGAEYYIQVKKGALPGVHVKFPVFKI